MANGHFKALCASAALLSNLASSGVVHAQNLGAWSSTISLPNIPISVAVLPNGNVYTWSSSDYVDPGTDVGTAPTSTLVSIYSPWSGGIAAAPDTGMRADMFCSGIAYLADGRLLVNGGGSSSHTGIYDFTTNKWTSGSPMNIARGYNSSVTLSSGAVFTIGGSWGGDAGPKDGELWTQANGWMRTAIPDDAIVATDDLFDQRVGELVSGDDHAWLFAMPNGRVFHAGPSRQMNFFDPLNGITVPAGLRGDDNYSINGFAVMYSPGWILKSGGAIAYSGERDPVFEQIDASSATYVIDLSGNYANPAAAPVVSRVASINHARAFANAVVLPDGEVFIVGGQSKPHTFVDTDAVMTPEIWNPATATSTDVAPLVTPRTYHSTALLLPDGRVFVGGGGQCGEGCEFNHFDFELYSPPYLFAPDGSNAIRPAIVTAPAGLLLGQSLTVTTSGSVASFALVRMSATTHTVNTDQRRIPLAVMQSSTTVDPASHGQETTSTLYVPSDPGITVPGYYMLFALSAGNVPSVAKIIQVQAQS